MYEEIDEKELMEKIKKKYVNASEFEINVLFYRTQEWNYQWICNKLQCKKKEISKVLNKWEPSLVNIDCNYKKLKKVW